MRTDKLYLIGFMGAGKSTMADALGKKLGWQAVDIDTLIEAREHRSISDIFSQNGEFYFRQIEREVLQELLPRRHTIVATGGGTFVDQTNRTTINNDGGSIWLDISFDQVISRLLHDKKRPLAEDRTTLRSLYETRKPAYLCSHLQLDASHASIEELIERVIGWLDN
jgi:shikimate kinase